MDRQIRRNIIFSLVFFINLVFATNIFAADIFVDRTLSNDITNGTYSAANRNNSGSDGDAYNTLEEALSAMNAGDTIYLRGGTYTEDWGDSYTQMKISTSKNGTSWEEGHYNTLCSYPGEWAVLDGSGSSASAVLGNSTNSYNDGANNLRYWKFERLEVKGGTLAGIGINRGPFIVRYCYIHDNRTDTYLNNPAGLRGYRWEECLIEFNYFLDNGSTDTTHHNCAHIQVFSDYAYSGFNINSCTKKNEVRYNLFNASSSSRKVGCGYKNKAAQYLGYASNGIMTDMTYKEYGDKIHHNIFLNTVRSVFGRQYFQQVYNNISDGGSICGEDGSSYDPIYRRCVYNNTVLENYISESMGYSLNYSQLDLGFWAVNNIVSNFGYADYSPSIGVAVNWLRQCSGNYTWTNTRIDCNLIHNPQHATYHIGLPDSYNCKSSRFVSVGTFNAQQGATNYTNSTANLFKGSSGAEQYVTNAGFVLSGSTTIANGGMGCAHPYLDGVMLPSYVGATDPNNSEWVGVVMALSDMSTLVDGNETIDETPDDDDTPDVVAPASPSGVSATVK